MAKVHSLMHQFNGRCTYCMTVVHVGTVTEPWHATIDHVIPKARKGPDTVANRVLCCMRCNSVKGDMTGDEFRYFMRTKMLPSSYVLYLTAALQRRLRGKVVIQQASNDAAV
jgi:5-methylcytosine-specific restriction endonuclease McrA